MYDKVKTQVHFIQSGNLWFAITTYNKEDFLGLAANKQEALANLIHATSSRDGKIDLNGMTPEQFVIGFVKTFNEEVAFADDVKKKKYVK